MKGITPVIATILLVLIVVALGGVFAAWTSRVASTTTEAGTKQVETVTGQLGKSISIDSVICTANGIIYVRNSGSDPVNCSDMSLYIDGALRTKVCDLPAVGLVSNNVTSLRPTATTYFDLASKNKTKVTVSGNSATYNC